MPNPAFAGPAVGAGFWHLEAHAHPLCLDGFEFSSLKNDCAEELKSEGVSL